MLMGESGLEGAMACHRGLMSNWQSNQGENRKGTEDRAQRQWAESNGVIAVTYERGVDCRHGREK
jgi:hypothetical protein